MKISTPLDKDNQITIWDGIFDEFSVITPKEAKGIKNAKYLYKPDPEYPRLYNYPAQYRLTAINGKVNSFVQEEIEELRSDVKKLEKQGYEVYLVNNPSVNSDRDEFTSVYILYVSPSGTKRAIDYQKRVDTHSELIGQLAEKRKQLQIKSKQRYEEFMKKEEEYLKKENEKIDQEENRYKKIINADKKRI